LQVKSKNSKFKKILKNNLKSIRISQNGNFVFASVVLTFDFLILTY